MKTWRPASACWTGSGKRLRTIRSQPDYRPTITDDTEQALLLADALLIGGGHLDSEDLARRLWPGQNARGNGDRWICWGHQAAQQWRRRRSVPTG